MRTFIVTLVLVWRSSAQEVALTTNLNVLMFNGTANDAFLLREKNFNCYSYLYAYAQPEPDYAQNTPIMLTITSPTPVNLTIGTVFSNFVPSLVPQICLPPSCQVQIYHNCPSSLYSDNYFDIVQLNISQLPTLSYSLCCNKQYNPVYFEWGQLIITICAAIVLIFATAFARLQAFGGSGIEYNIKWIIIISGSILTVGLIAVYAPGGTAVFLDVVSWILGTVCAGIVALELLFLIGRHTFLRNQHKIGPLTIRNVDILSGILGLSLVFAWWFSHKNWILSDSLSICIVVSAIKIFKFVSLKIALVSYATMLVITIIGAVLPQVKYDSEQPSFFMRLDCPFQFQVPVISATYSVNCTWISVTSMAFPGLLVAYLHRFDKSRDTNIYLLSTIFAYFMGAILWNCISALSFYPIPFDCITEPFMIATLSLMACSRKELRTIWDGTFYDQEFMHKKEIQLLGRTLSIESPHIDLLLESIPDSIYIGSSDFQSEPSKEIDNDEL